MNKMRIWLLMLLFLVGVGHALQTVQAENYSYVENIYTIINSEPYMKDGKAVIEWLKCVPVMDETKETFRYEVQIADDEAFTNAKQYFSASETLVLDKSEFGEHGGRFYVRVRGVLQLLDQTASYYTRWSETKEIIFVAIDKTNFPGMYEVMKNGGEKIDIITGDLEKIIYDENVDGWIDSVEAKKVFSINTTDVSKKVKGKYKLIKATSISCFDGVEYFPNLHSIQVMRYSGKKADLSKCSATIVEFRRHTSKKLTVIAPNAKEIRVIEPVKENVSIDLGKCSGAVSIDVNAENKGGTGAKVLKLPKEKTKLKVLELCEVHVKTLNLNAYTNLQQLELNRCNTKSVKMNKCKNLRYLFICRCKKIKSLNLKSNKNLRGADFYETPGLTKKTVKKSKSGKYTWNKGTWWEKTSAYKQDMKELY